MPVTYSFVYDLMPMRLVTRVHLVKVFLYSVKLMPSIFGDRNSICGHMSSRLRETGVPFSTSFHSARLPTSNMCRVRLASAFFTFRLSSTMTIGTCAPSTPFSSSM